MDNVKIIAEYFLLSLVWTLTLFSPIASSKLTGNGLIKLLSNVSLSALFVALVVSFIDPNPNHQHLMLFLKILSFAALMVQSLYHRDDKSWAMWACYGVVVIATGYHLVLFSENLSSTFFLLSSSLFLGVITYSMLLGHWYLVVPKLSEKPLKIAAVLTWIIMAAKIAVSSYTIYHHLDFFQEQTILGSGYAFNWMLLLMRICFGYLVILGMSLFNWKLVKMRSIQSSTGILYSMTFFILIGEMVSQFIYFNYRLFI